MTTYSATFQAAHADELQRLILRDDGCEHAAYILFNKANINIDPWDRQAHVKYLSAKIVPVPDEQVLEATPNLVSWQTASFIRSLKEAVANDQVLAIIHSHPGGLRSFSRQDDTNEAELVQLAQNRNGPDTPMLSFIMTADKTLTGRIWLSRQYHAPMRLIRTIGESFRLHYASRGFSSTRLAFDRQALAFGKALNEDLSRLRVGVVGCGGTGSAVAMLLPRVGIGHVGLIDNDIVDVTNLNRLHGARQADADAMAPKVQVVARAIAELGLGTRVVYREAWVGDPECYDLLKSCDIIFGCTDDNEGRLFLSRLALFYLIPVIDLGLAIKVTDAGPPAIEALDGRVTVLTPGNACLSCRGVVEAARAAEEAMRRTTPALYEKRKAEAYVFGEGNPNPVVVTFTTELATMAVNEMLQRFNGFRGPHGFRANQLRRFHLMMDAKPGARAAAGCALCDSEGYWGRGDMKPFLDRTS
ncbi:JAB domain-containing protein [Enhydrobacter aerosaccus]|uniref:JAB domain-containing protein n=1 Tax=Enhydrobacter aerosaccus TaxID=225324 RepID=A0A1T4TLM4_9HYPH|nr:ThiF family adenylyltransferase [Enhydrobacter aerosaccus]SKA41284.1 JAB domain-containing protein [Enhydrobacter aerosaccus]